MRRTWIAALLLLVAGAGGAAYWYMVRPSGEQREARRPPPAVVLADVGTATITRTVEAVGSTRAVESVVLTSKAAGRIEAIAFGDREMVEKDEVLVRFEQEEIRAELAAVEAEAAEVAQSLARSEDLLSRGSAPRAVVDDTRRRLQAARARITGARKRLDDATIRAPFSGRVGLRDVSVGALIEPGTPLATLDSISPIDLRFSVPEQDLGDIKVGAKVEAETPAFPEQNFAGEVRAIDNRVDPALRTVTVEARLPNPGGILLPGMLMNVRLAVETVREAVVVPPIAVLVRGSKHFVYGVDPEGKARRLEIEIGQREPQRLQITRGLEAGQRIVVEGVQEVTDGQPVQVKEGAPDHGGPEVAARQSESQAR